MKILKLLLTVLIFSTLVSCSKKGYDQKACIVGNCAGILCESSTGNTCSSTSGCTAVPNGCGGNQQLVAADVEQSATEHANYLLKEKVIEEYQVEYTKQLVRQILKPNMGSEEITK